MITDIAVIVPAADEQDEIAGCLRSIRDAARSLTHARTHVVVVLDACVDDTAGVVARFPGVSAVPSTARCVGSARRQGADHALARYGTEGVWLASTDADCRVPSDWLTNLAAQAAAGADVVLGTVRPRGGLPADVAYAWQVAHDLSDGHPHVHGANLGISAAAYAQLGGWHDLPVHEDVDLVARAVAGGKRIVRTGAAPVRTSSRLSGRALGGFASHLRALHDASTPAEQQTA